MKLKDRVAIVTGAASGIGRASAIAFAREGARVAVVDRNERGGCETVAAIQSEGREAFFDCADVTKEAEVARAAVYLVSDESEGITGILHVVDGGLIAASEFNVPL